jgi:subtilisin family serine protease
MLRRITTSFIVLTLLAVSLAPLADSASAASNSPKHTSKVAPELSGATSSQTVRVIVQTKGRPTQAHDGAISAKGGSKRQSFDELNALTADVPANAVASLAAREDVEYVSPDRQVRASLDVTRESVGASQVQAGVGSVKGLTGKGVGIAVIDSGISARHPDFKKNN